MTDAITLRRVNKTQPNTREYWSAHKWIANRYGYPSLCESEE